MRILTHINSESINAQMLAVAPAAEIIPVEFGAELPPGLDGEVLLTLGIIGDKPIQQMLETAPSLRWIHVFGTGVENFPLHLVGDRILTCSRGAHALPIAEWVLAMMLAHEKQLPDSLVSEPPESWHTAKLGSLAGKTLGILGFGCIGELVAQRALPFDMRVQTLTRSMRTNLPEGVVAAADLQSLVAAADHLLLAAPATAATQHIINADSLAYCKPEAHLINVARGSLVDQDALRQVLDSELLSAASLDVVDPEPLPAGHWMYTHPKVRVSPHISWSAPGMVEALAVKFIANLERFVDGKTLQDIVDTDAGY